MPRTKKKAPNRGSSKQKDKNGPQDDTREPIEKSDMHNARFEAYYKAQNIIPDDAEWKVFMDALKRGLPTTFRVAGSRMTAHTLNVTITDTYVPLLSDAIFDGERVPPPARIPWYPEGLAWQFNVSKKVLRKSPEFKKFHSFLVFETEIGNISRQEAVSMLPPLFMDVEPHHVVLDMCAAPGSKSAQLLESLHLTDTPTCMTTPPGLLIANDADQKRCHLLVHQSARLGSPSLMVTNLDASIFPIIRVPATSTSTTHHSTSHTSDSSNETQKGKRARRKKEKVDQTHPNLQMRTRQLLFDRILCDVPCSGDGTIRKNLGIWKGWNGGDGNGLHGLQLRILQRAMKMLKEEGRIVYSTCSMNPVENEAVIAAALKSNPEYELVDVSSRLPTLIRRPGLHTWRPTVDKMIDTSFTTYEAYVGSLSEEKKTETKMLESHWPPTKEEAGGLWLERCMRIYPHLQDTGGFFVAVLQRKVPNEGGEEIVDLAGRKREAETPVDEPELKKPRLADDDDDEVLPANGVELESSAATPSAPLADEDVVMESESKADEPAVATPQQAVFKGKGKAKGDGGFKEHPYTYLASDDPILQSCVTRLNLNADFPASNVLVRNPEGAAVRSLYLTNGIIKAIVEYNDYTRLRIINCGTKVFTKQDGGRGTDPSFRVLGEGLPVVLPYIHPETILDCDIGILKTLLSVYYPLCRAFPEPFKSVIEAREPGSHVIRFLPGVWDSARLAHELVLPIWKSNVSLTLMIDKKAKSALSLRLFGEDVTVGAREVALQKGSGAPTPTGADSVIDEDLKQIGDVAIPEVDIGISN